MSQIDLMATIASAIGYDLPKENAAEDSHNLLPLLGGGTAPVRTTHVHNTSAKRWAIRHGDWVLVDAKSGYQSKVGKNWEKKHKYPADDNQPAELYNLKDDISQRHNLAKDYPEKVAELQELLKTTRTGKRTAP